MQLLGPLLQRLPLLQRTMMAIITVKKLPDEFWKLFKPEVIIGNIYVHLASGSYISPEVSITTHNEYVIVSPVRMYMGGTMV
jgi:hypothetical protein